jgi:RNA polymerase sigma-70 factor (family 1)
MDIQLFRTYYDEYYQQLCHFLTFYTRDIYIIEDIIQDIFLSLWNNREHINIDHIKPYLFQAAKNNVIKRLQDEENKHKILEKWYQRQIEEENYQDCFDLDEFDKLLNDTISKLPPKCREIYILSRKEHLTYKQIADYLNISIKTVENQISIALKKIKETFAEILLLLFIMLFNTKGF